MIPLEILQQFNWWIIRPLIHKNLEIYSNKELSNLYFLACHINCFTKLELKSWISILDTYDWGIISEKIPNSLSIYVHRERHRLNKYCSKSAIKTLMNKKKLYDKTPEKWKPKYFIFNSFSDNYGEKIIDNPWFISCLKTNGIVIKPLKGYGCNDIYRFRLQNNILWKEKFFNQKASILLHLYLPIKECEILKIILNSLKNVPNSLIFMPYISANHKFPECSHSPVIRVITKKGVNGNFEIITNWLEIPCSNKMVYVNKDGFLNFNPPNNKVTKNLELEKWADYLKANDHIFESCNQPSIYMHKKLDLIDQVAWDWIPSREFPTLLEGNSFFSLLEPQQFLYFQNSLL